MRQARSRSGAVGRLARLATCAALALLTACASPPAPSASDASLVWPSPPQRPRVVFLQAFSSAEDLGIRRGVLQRLGDFMFGSAELRLVRPMAVLEASGVLYVADPGVRGVHRFDREGGGHRVLRLAGGGPLPSPVGLALGEGGTVFVTDSALRRVFAIGPDADSAVEWPTSVPLRQPTGLAYDPAGARLFVTDTAAHQVRVFDRGGQQLATIGQRGVGDGEFNYPTLLWRDAAGKLLVSDSLNFRVQVFDADGRFVTRFGRAGDAAGDLARHKGVATDSRGHVYVADGSLHAVQVFDLEGRLLLAIGAQGRDRGEFWSPAGIFVTPDDRIFVADAFNQRVQVFRFVGGEP